MDLLRAISHANKILDWHENMVEDDIPPEWMWTFDEALNEWFEDLKASRANPTPEHTEVPMMENEFAAGRGR